MLLWEIVFSPFNPFAPQEPECHLAGRQIIFIYNLYVSGIVVLGGQSSHFYIIVNLGGLKGVLHPRPVFGLFMHFSQNLQHIGNK